MMHTKMRSFSVISLALLFIVNIGNAQSSEQQKILDLYFSKKLSKEDGKFVYNSSIDKKILLRSLDYPLSKKKMEKFDFNFFSPHKSDIHFSGDDIQAWNKQIQNYKSITWKQPNFINVEFISSNEIPNFIKEGGLPQKKEKTYIKSVLYLGLPFISENKALLFVYNYAGPLNSSRVIYYFEKDHGNWKISGSGLISTS